MTTLLDAYCPIIGEEHVDHLRQLAAPLAGMKIVHINSTKVGGGVAEILSALVPLERELGLDVSWEVVTGLGPFYECTKRFHNALQGNAVAIPETMLKTFEDTIHDPQPLPLLRQTPDRRGKWVWRCHIDVSRPHRPVWRYLRNYVAEYDASIFSLAAFSQPLPHPSYLIAPGIDPLSDKNRDLDPDEVKSVYERFRLDPTRPLVLQVSRFDRFKDPVGVIRAYQIAKNFVPTVQLVLAGGGATDDPEGEAVLAEVRSAAPTDPDVHILLLPPDAHLTINALQRAADIVVQKSIREGFGLTVAEGLWKGKPVIGGDTGGIRLQVVNHHTGFLVSSPEGAALRIRYLLHYRDRMQDMGLKAKEYVRENFLLTRLLREHLTLMVGLYRQGEGRIYLD
jgi:trehalose synthase